MGHLSRSMPFLQGPASLPAPSLPPSLHLPPSLAPSPHSFASCDGYLLMPTCAKKLLYAGACLVAAGLLTCLVLITLSFIQLGSPGEVLIDGQENFTLTAVEPRIGFTFFREWGTNGTEHCRTLHIISPSGNDVTFWCGVHSISQPQLEKTGHVELNRASGR